MGTATMVKDSRRSLWRSRWAAIGAAVAVTLGGGGLFVANAASSAPSSLITIDPCRLVDTRPAPDTVGTRSTPIGNAETVTFGVHGTNGQCVIPSSATGISANVTVVSPSTGGFLTLFPAGGSRPLASNLNFVAEQAPTPNAVTVGLGGGKVSVYNHAGTVNVIIDIVGYYDPATSGPAGPVDVRWARVDSDSTGATLLVGSGVSAVTRITPGSYRVEFTSSVVNCAYTATLSDNGTGGAAPGEITVERDNDTQIRVRTFDSAGTQTDRVNDDGFTLMVMCATS